jgi:hypothetical protein
LSSPSQPGSQSRQPKAKTVVSNVSLLPVFKLNLKSERKVSDSSFNEIKYNNQLTKLLFNAKIDRMNGHTYLIIVLGSLPPSKLDRVVSFAGYVRMNASAHKK